MLTLSTTQNSVNLLRQAVHLLKTRNHRLQDAYDLAKLAGVDCVTVETFVKVGELLAEKGRIDLASGLLAMVDVGQMYNENPRLKDLYARIGWVLYWPSTAYTSRCISGNDAHNINTCLNNNSDDNIEKLLLSLKHDETIGRISHSWKLKKMSFWPRGMDF